MNIKKHLLCICLCMLAGLALEAQTGERAKNRAENRANQRVDQKVDQAVDRAAEKIEGLFRRKKTEEQAKPTEEETVDTEDGEVSEEETAGFLSRMNLGGGEFEPYENSILMNLSMKYTMTNNRGKESSSVMHYTLDTWQTGIEIESEEVNVRMLMDNQEGSTTMITTEKGETSAFKMRQRVVDLEEVTPDESSYTITELGNTRVINGYNCTEYLIEYEEGTTNAWMTTDLDVDMTALSKAMLSFARQSKKTEMPQNFAPAGFPIESTTVTKNGKETIFAQYYDFKIGDDIDKSVFDIGGIKVMSIGF